MFLPEGYHDSNDLYPTVYLLDSNVFFSIVKGTSHLLQVAEEIPKIILIGIGYPDESKHLTLRGRDLLPTHHEEASLSGGADAFYWFLVNDLRSFIESKFRVNPQENTLAGDSYSGLFSLYALFKTPLMFKKFIIGSPSIYWDNRVIFKYEEEYALDNEDMKAQVFMGVGQLEAIYEPEFANMVGNVIEMKERLDSRNYKSLDLMCTVFDNETHMSVIPSIMSRGLRLVFNSEKVNR